MDLIGACTEIKQQCFELMNNHFVHIDDKYGLTDDCVNEIASILQLSCITCAFRKPPMHFPLFGDH